ncbi:MAG: HupE/UreJ family protein [Verrucomicrobiota bacterium]
MTRSVLGLLFLASAAAVIPKFFVMGFTHILPGGPDHILFILGLFFLTRGFGVLFFQMTLFTLAHSLTLGLSLYGFLSVPTAVVEVAIALSIAFIAIENLFFDDISRWRPYVVFGFGLIHGLGFAHSFAENLVDSGDFLPALFSFNMGIEFGQLAVVGIAYAAVAAWWKRDCYQKLVARPASCAIAASGLYWAVDRSF